MTNLLGTILPRGYHKPYPIHALWITVRIGFTWVYHWFACKVYPIVSYGLDGPWPDGLVEVSVMGGIWWHYFERTSPLQTPGQRCRSFSATCFNLAKPASIWPSCCQTYLLYLYFTFIQMCTVRIWIWRLGMVGVKPRPHEWAESAGFSLVGGSCKGQSQAGYQKGDGWWWMLQPLHQVKWLSIPSASFATRVWTPSDSFISAVLWDG